MNARQLNEFFHDGRTTALMLCWEARRNFMASASHSRRFSLMNAEQQTHYFMKWWNAKTYVKNTPIQIEIEFPEALS